MNERRIKSDQHISIGANIKRIRKERNIQPMYLVKHMNLRGFTSMTKQHFYKLENDIANISASELVVLAELLKVEIKDFFQPL